MPEAVFNPTVDIANAYIYRRRTNVSQVAADMPTGAIIAFGGSVAPVGWLLCDGSAVSRTQFAALFATIGTTYGSGDGVTTFNVPDMRGRSTVGAGQGTGLTNRVRGATGGEETHQLLTGELANHNHSAVSLGSTSSNFLTSGANATALTAGSSVTGNQGSGTGHNVMHPFLVNTHIIQT
jgi:microcystin-dependent protein